MDNGTKAPRQRQRDTAGAGRDLAEGPGSAEQEAAAGRWVEAGAWLDEADDQRTARIGPPREIPGAPRYWGRRRAS